MDDSSQALIERSGYEGDGFAELYNRYRPSPPKSLLEILMLVAQVARPRLVVDLGAGTGLSTRVWSECADEVIGVEANGQMVDQARQATKALNVRFVEAFATRTELPAGSADIVTCAQSFHWMEPSRTLEEASRILRVGGVFAAYDYDVPPVVHPEIDSVFAAHFEARRLARVRLGLEAGAASWPKEHHLERISESERFRFAREVVCSSSGETDADRIVGLAESIGGPQAIFGDQAPGVSETFKRLREVAHRVIGKRPSRQVVCYRIRLGVK